MITVSDGSLLPGGRAAPPVGPHDSTLAMMLVSLLLVWLLTVIR